MKLTFLISILLIVAANANEVRISHCNGSCPTGTSETNVTVITPIYALSNNQETKFADWVAYQVTPSTIGTSADHGRTWRADPQLENDETLEPGDYKGASNALTIDRGHQAPLAAFSGTVYWRMTNYLSNITPQKKSLNQGPWMRLEARIRDAAYRLNGVYVVTGPLYENDMDTLPLADETHKVPSGYWKVVVKNNNAVGFIMEQDIERSMGECNAVVTIEKIEQRSGLELFPNESLNDQVGSITGCQ
jgi:endonuclease G, mitochondrial